MKPFSWLSSRGRTFLGVVRVHTSCTKHPAVMEIPEAILPDESSVYRSIRLFNIMRAIVVQVICNRTLLFNIVYKGRLTFWSSSSLLSLPGTKKEEPEKEGTVEQLGTATLSGKGSLEPLIDLQHQVWTQRTYGEIS